MAQGPVGVTNRQERLESQMANKPVEYHGREGLVQVEWGYGENTKNNMHISFSGILGFWRKQVLRIVRNWEHVPEWRTARADMRRSSSQGLENSGSLSTPFPLVFKCFSCSLSGSWSWSLLVANTKHSFLMSTRLSSSSYISSPG